MAISPALLESTARHSVYLERLKSHEANQFTAFLQQIDRDIRQRLSTGEALTEFSKTRLERLLASITQALQTIYQEHYDELAGRLIEIGEYEAEFESRNINQVLANFETVIPAVEQVRAAAFSNPLSVRGADGGKLLEPFIKDWQQVEIKRVTGAIRQGAFEGQTNDQIIRNIRGTKANNYRDGILALSQRNAGAITRTAVQHVASEARFQTWEANKRIAKGYRWVATLDSRTSRQCQALDGRVFEMGKGPRPPLHINCRSTTVLELDDRFKFLSEGATRSSKDGPVDAKETYYSWLKKQPAEFQDDALGKTRAQLFRDGGLSADDFARLNLGRDFQPLTLDEMRKKEPKVFDRALNSVSDSEEEVYQAGKRYVVKNGRKQGGEFAYIADKETGRVLVQKKGESRSVSFTPEEIQAIRSSKNAVLYHNHPSGSSLSGADLLFAKDKELKAIVAFATKGKGEYSAEVIASMESLQDKHRKAGILARNLMAPLVQKGDLSAHGANSLLPHLMNTMLHEIGVIKYTATALSKSTQIGLNEVGEKQFKQWLDRFSDEHAD